MHTCKIFSKLCFSPSYKILHIKENHNFEEKLYLRKFSFILHELVIRQKQI